MSDETTQPQTNTAPAAAAGAPAPRTGGYMGRGGGRGGAGGRGGPGGRSGGGRPGGGRPGGRGGPQRERSEFANKIIDIRRVARVVAGGRRFSFSVSMVIGDKKGRVGVGIGKAGDTALAIDKATRAAKKNMIALNLTENRSIRHDVGAKFSASVVEIRPAKGRGLVAGSSVRIVLEHAGITDVTAKVLSRSHNPVNNARAAIEALRVFTMPSKTMALDKQVQAGAVVVDKAA